MTWFVIIFSTLTIALLAVLMYVMPSIMHSTLPLGVSVPQERTGDPAIESSVRRYRVAIIASLVVSLAITVMLGTMVPAAGVTAPVLVFIALSIGSYVAARSSITRAKRDGGWYDDVPVRLAADVTAPRPISAIPFWWYLTAIVPLVIATGVGVAVYPNLPNPLPIHWDLNGVANGFAEKSVWSALGIVMVGFGIVALMFGLSFAVRGSRPLRVATDSPGFAARRARTQQRLMGGLLGQITLVTTLELSFIAVVGWLAPAVAWLPLAAIVLPVLLIAAATVLYLVRYRRSMAAQPLAAAGATTATHERSREAIVNAPDDDRFWKSGIFYLNRADPALMVPKRFGVGWTINLGDPAGIAIGVLILLVIAGSITFAILSPGSRH
jgi:uncharacterized membrane protein